MTGSTKRLNYLPSAWRFTRVLPFRVFKSPKTPLSAAIPNFRNSPKRITKVKRPKTL